MHDALATLATLDAGARNDYIKNLIAQLIQAQTPAKELNRWRDTFADQPWLNMSTAGWNQCVKDLRRGTVPEDKLLPPPQDPLAVARAIAPTWAWPEDPNVPTIISWRGDTYQWTGTNWTILSEAEWLAKVWQRIEGSSFIDGRGNVKSWMGTPLTIGNVVTALSKVLFRRNNDLEPETPIACHNGIFDPKSRTLHPHSPRTFNLSSLPYDYNPEATCPNFDRLLDGSTQDDVELRRLLGQIFGYMISGDTSRQRFFILHGESGSGKGTIVTALRSLLGRQNCSSAGMRQLGTNFGLASAIGKSAILMPDTRWKIDGMSQSTDMIKAISGRDPIDIDRKNREAWSGVLGARIIATTNYQPEFREDGLAIQRRMVLCVFAKRKVATDITLSDKIEEELSGVLNWALAGLDDLNELGDFIVPASSVEAADETARASNSAYAWLRDHCIMDPTAETAVSDAYDSFIRWCQDTGRSGMRDAEFSRKLISSMGGIITKLPNAVVRNGKRCRVLVGFKLDPSLTNNGPWIAGSRQATKRHATLN